MLFLARDLLQGVCWVEQVLAQEGGPGGGGGGLGHEAPLHQGPDPAPGFQLEQANITQMEAAV